MEGKIKEAHHEKFGRYFLAIIPPEPFYTEIETLKNYFCDRYTSKAALNSPPHITLHMPFEWKRQKEKILCDRLNIFFANIDAFELALVNFSCFAPKTIFIGVPLTAELRRLEKELQKFCKKEFNLFNARYRDLPFHPHCTIAFRDLSKALFARAWSEFRERKFEGNFGVTRVALLKHSGKLWEPLHYFMLS